MARMLAALGRTEEPALSFVDEDTLLPLATYRYRDLVELLEG